MERISIIENFTPRNDARLLKKAEELAPELHWEQVAPVAAFRLKERYSSRREAIPLKPASSLPLGAGDNLCLDFGDHRVGYLSLELAFEGSHPDAPAFVKLKFAETPEELSENTRDYEGWISKSWLQEEYIHVDTLPARIDLPRRYAFRYVKITVIDTSRKYRLTVKCAECRAVTSANMGRVTPLKTGDEMLDRIDAVGLKTLAECMQSVFEDGPKRDRRLWLGDFRLQALTSYVSFRNLELVKRCLYLFAGSRFPDGRIAACLFTDPEVACDDTWFPDYALFYPVALEEYLRIAGDREALEDLYDPAVEQVEISLAMRGEDHLVHEEFARASFIDWCDGLEKRACAQAVLLYALPYAIALARRKGDAPREEKFARALEEGKRTALNRFWDEEQECFVSEGQASLTTQIWMVLADTLPRERAATLLATFPADRGEYPMVSPYMHHYYLEALLHAGLRDRALTHIREYWGSMIERGADTFWEIWDPAHPDASPYGGKTVNSYCHAWSCTPAYLLRTYFFPKGGD